MSGRSVAPCGRSQVSPVGLGKCRRRSRLERAEPPWERLLSRCAADEG